MISNTPILSHRNRDRMSVLAGEEFTILAVTSGESQFSGCTRHTVLIGKDDYQKTLDVHAQGLPPVVGSACRRKRLGGNGVALIWDGRDGRAIGGGFTLAAVPPDWRGLANAMPSRRQVMADQVHAAVLANDGNPTGFKGKVNTYTCDSCDYVTVTVDVDDGVTPFMIGCPAVRCAGGSAKSGMYQVDQNLVPTHEWFKPTDLSGYSANHRQHVEMGGLVMRPRAA